MIAVLAELSLHSSMSRVVALTGSFAVADAAKIPYRLIFPDEQRMCHLLDLLNAILTKGETRTPLRKGAKTLDLVLAAIRSNDQRAEVRV